MSDQQPQQMQLEPQFVIQALQAELGEAMNKVVNLTALANQQQAQIQKQAEQIDALGAEVSQPSKPTLVKKTND